MNVLESPLEALAFNYVSFGFFALVNNLWTWIAFVTAAISFWRIRVAGALPIEDSSPAIDDRASISLSPSPEIEEKPEESSTAACFAEKMLDSSATRGSRKFFAMYCESDGDLTEERDLTVTVTEKETEWFAWWERALRTRLGESESAGWYRYQDLTALNGSVVRLWE